MKIGIMQPYFFPYLGYWQLMNAVDQYIVYDDVNYIQQGWINRNYFLLNSGGGGAKMFGIQIHKASSFKLINDLIIQDDFKKFKKMIDLNYAHAPFFYETKKILDSILNYTNLNLASFLFNSILKIAEYLDFKTNIILSSSLNKNNLLKGEEKVIHICKILNAKNYYNSIGGKELYCKENFEKENINLKFLKPNLKSYPQFKFNFIPNLSIVDVLMFCGKENTKNRLEDFELIH